MDDLRLYQCAQCHDWGNDWWIETHPHTRWDRLAPWAWLIFCTILLGVLLTLSYA